jgi:hypothetical protein
MRGRIGPIASSTARSAGTKASRCCRNHCCTGSLLERQKQMMSESQSSPHLATISWMLRHLCRRTIPTVSKRVGVGSSSKQSESDTGWVCENPSRPGPHGPATVSRHVQATHPGRHTLNKQSTRQRRTRRTQPIRPMQSLASRDGSLFCLSAACSSATN